MQIKRYYLPIELMATEKRRRTVITMAGSVKNYLKYLYEQLDVEKYNFSYLVEDIIVWVISDKERLRQFIDDNFEFEEGLPEVVDPSPEDLEIIKELSLRVLGEIPEELKEELDKIGETLCQEESA